MHHAHKRMAVWGEGRLGCQPGQVAQRRPRKRELTSKDEEQGEAQALPHLAKALRQREDGGHVGLLKGGFAVVTRLSHRSEEMPREAGGKGDR